MMTTQMNTSNNNSVQFVVLIWK